MELLVLVSLLGIIAVLVVPLASDRDGDRVRNAARMFVADLEYAQLRSIGDGTDPCVVVFDTDTGGYHLARRSDPLTPITDPSNGQAYTTDYGAGRASILKGVTIDSTDDLADGQLEFTALGSLNQPNNPSITLRSGVRTVHVVVDATTGEPRVE